MNYLRGVKNWLFGGEESDASAAQGDPSEPGRRQVVIRVPVKPVISDALDPPTGGVQGFNWFLEAFRCDEWGNIGHELLETVQGKLKKSKRRKFDTSSLVWKWSCDSPDCIDHMHVVGKLPARAH
eukprot:TRINITY_DN10248_c0_g2_i2.p3 TRINITY_DN10248_c0_g2~~TRINITY_DN10248_c0_g2_i2.p3  ORF type:complete len:125 (-),score=10.02 TRINITY_DN10248_c0_g2_i2:417-791(-)